MACRHHASSSAVEAAVGSAAISVWKQKDSRVKMVEVDGAIEMAHEVEHTGSHSAAVHEPEEHFDEILTPDEPIIVAQYYKIDSNGKKRKYARTRGGREIPYMTDD